MLWKGVYMNTWMIGKNSIKYHYQKKKYFHSHLSMEDITDADYTHTKRVCKDFKTTNFGEYHDLYFKSDTLLLADIFIYMCLMSQNMRLSKCASNKWTSAFPFSYCSRIILARTLKKEQSKTRCFNICRYFINNEKWY